MWAEFVIMLKYSNLCLIGDFTKSDDIAATRLEMRKVALKRCRLSQPFCKFFHKTKTNGTASETDFTMGCVGITDAMFQYSQVL